MQRCLNLLNSCICVELQKSLEERQLVAMLSIKTQLLKIGYKPEDLKNVIHVAGTKGKGSVAAFTESAIRSHNVKTGLFTSPHLVNVQERIRINGIPISEDKFTKYFFQIWPKLENISYFNLLTCLAFHTFIQEKVQVAIMEVGMGGRCDATNIVHPISVAITSIGLDHTEHLGTTKTQIAMEKAGIMKKNIPCFTIKHEQEVQKVLETCSMDLCPLIQVENMNFKELGISGSHQQQNASLAMALAMHFCKIKSSKEMLKGLKNTNWPGRCQTLVKNGKTYYLDGAHTIESIYCCLEWFKEKRKSCGLIFGVSGNRDIKSLLEPIANYHKKEKFTQVYFVGENKTKISKEWQNFTGEVGHESDLSTLNLEDNFLITGSLKLVGDMLSKLEYSCL